MSRPKIEAWKETGAGLLDPGWYAADAEARQGPCETKAEAINRIRELRGLEPLAGGAARRASKAAAAAAAAPTVRVPCSHCAVCRLPFQKGHAVVIRGRRCLCMPDAMKSGKTSGVVVEYLGDGLGR